MYKIGLKHRNQTFRVSLGPKRRADEYLAIFSISTPSAFDKKMTKSCLKLRSFKKSRKIQNELKLNVTIFSSELSTPGNH